MTLICWRFHTSQAVVKQVAQDRLDENKPLGVVMSLQAQSSCGLRSETINGMDGSQLCRPSESSLQLLNTPTLTVLTVKITSVQQFYQIITETNSLKFAY